MVRRQVIVNFIIPTGAGVLVLGRDHKHHIVKNLMYYFFKNILLYSRTPSPGVLVLGIGHIVKIYTRTWIRQIKYVYIVMITKELSPIPVNFMTHGARVLMLGRDHISHYSDYALSSSLSIYSSLILTVFRDYNAAFICHFNFFNYSMNGLLI